MKKYTNLVKYSVLATLAIFFVSAFATDVSAAANCGIPSQSGRIIVRFDGDHIFSSKGLGEAYTAESANIPAGKYKVTLYGYDGYSARTSASQPNERYYVRLMSGGLTGTLVASSNSLSDLADRVAFAERNQVVNSSLTVSSNINTVIAAHSAYPDNSSPNSIVPGCVAFDPISSTPTPTPPVNQTLSGSCSVNPSSISVGGSLSWNSVASGGAGSYTYSWTGTDGLSANSSAVSRVYQSAGTKTGTVTITSGSQSITRTCNATVNDNPSNNLSVSCDVDDSSVEVDEDVTYTASASGGTGSYSYDWSGSEGLRGSSRNVTWSYDDDGTKNASVTVTSGSQSASASCSVRVREEEEDDDLEVRCYANPTNPQIGERMNWYVNVSGGDGDYDYDWEGSDDLNSSSRSPSMTYYTGGRKNATVEVTSDGQRDTATCYATVNQNTVLAFSQSNPVPLASAVYLSQVPYTGLADNLKLAWFVISLALFSAYVAYVVVSYKKSVGELK